MEKPNLEKYLKAIVAHCPPLATVLDYDDNTTLNEVLMWAESVAPYVDTVIIIPKVSMTIDSIPMVIGGKPVRLGYSIPTKHGATDVPIWEFRQREVHLLGGSPVHQLTVARYLNVKSADGNYMQKIARWGRFFVGRQMNYDTLSRTKKVDEDVPYIAFEQSVKNFVKAW
ncbi:MAG: DUF6610 family protein [bacterium]|nr:DUF6610 family protein [bacterium]